MDLSLLNTLPSLHSLYVQIIADMGNSQIWIVVVASCLMLATHAIAVLGVATAFHKINGFMVDRNIFGASFVSYFIAINLIILIHLIEIVIWSYICVGLKVFPSNPQTFYFAGEMYTTVGYGTWTLPSQWKILPILIAFTGVFAVSMSGAALYTMMGSFIGGKKERSTAQI
ncbi:hypothetical protein TUM22923_08380 [Polynucleobacter sp. TUM22923]|jgi:hypothetical protein|uniref:ion channel n=1 Tax=Polynucleobacter sp. TUM22923 TaxID=3022126 RepID=UPI0025742219|nr:ion channel [Polynucleobacter sp. TUM22923]BDX21517.1 hypothetical protein TUM22923_08380 [Polynucleobacter sp. TUM22923]